MSKANLSALFGSRRSPAATLVNVKDDDYDIYIGRGSVWGNPYTHLENTAALFKVGSREEAVEKYRTYILGHPLLLEQLPTLKGKILGCWCRPKRCHGEILIDLLEERLLCSKSDSSKTEPTVPKN